MIEELEGKKKEDAKDSLLSVPDKSIFKSTFESLNLISENGKPKFRLNEPAFNSINNPFQSTIQNHFNDDDDDETSFVVLGQCSLDFVNQASLLDYDEIQQKCSSIDYNSIISTLSHEEVERKVAELMKENVKLRETVAKNNSVMKKHFNTLVNWQEELMRVHGNHKQKFAETRDMVSFLKKENAQLKTMMNSLVADDAAKELTLEKKSSLNPETLIQSIDNLTLQSNLTEISMINSIDNIKLNDEIDKNIEEELKNLRHLKSKYERENHYLQEIIATLKAQLNKMNESSFQPIEMEFKDTDLHSKHKKQFYENFKHYNDKLNILLECYSNQTVRFMNIFQHLMKSIDALQSIESELPSKLDEYKKILNDCKVELINEQSANISERQNLIKAQNQFQKIFSDYNSVISELEILEQEVLKPKEKPIDLIKEQKELEEMKKNLKEAEEMLKIDRKNFLAEQLIFQQEKANLNDEKASLNSQSILYEAQMRNLNGDVKVLEKRHDDMLAENVKLKEEIQHRNKELSNMKSQLESNKEDIDTIDLLRQQLEIYKSDFEEERKAKLELMNERETLSIQMGKLRDHNHQLLQSIKGRNPNHEEEFCTTCGMFKMPGQWHGPGFCQLND